MKEFNFEENGQIIKVPLERWCWGVIYKPTPEAIKEAEERNKQIDEQIDAEMRQELNKANIEGKYRELERGIRDKFARKKVIMTVNPKSNELHQFGNDGWFHRIGEIDQTRLKLVSLYKADDMSKRIDIAWRPGMRLVHKYLNIKPYWRSTFSRIYVFGYKMGNEHSLNFVMPNDTIIMGPDDNIDFSLMGI